MKPVWLVLLLPYFLIAFVQSARAMRDPIGPPPPEPYPKANWTYLPPNLKQMGRCEEIFASREPSFSLRIIAHQNWLRFQLTTSPNGLRPRRAKRVETLYRVAGPAIRAAVNRLTNDPEIRAQWMKRLGQTDAPPAELKERLVWLARLNERLIDRQDMFLDSVSGPLIQIMRNLKVFMPGEVPERPIDVQAFSVMRSTTLELRENPDTLAKVENAVEPHFRESADEALLAIRQLVALRTQTPKVRLPPRITSLTNLLVTLQADFESATHDREEKRLIATDPYMASEEEDHLHLQQPEATETSLELTQRELYHEMIIYLQDIRNATQLARMNGGLLK